MPHVGQELLTVPDHVCSVVPIALSLDFGIMTCRSLFVLFLLTIAFLLRLILQTIFVIVLPLQYM